MPKECSWFYNDYITIFKKLMHSEPGLGSSPGRTLGEALKGRYQLLKGVVCYLLCFYKGFNTGFGIDRMFINPQTLPKECSGFYIDYVTIF